MSDSPASTADSKPATRVATGRFTVTLTPQGERVSESGVSTGRLHLAKQFEGDLLGTGEGEMLSALTPVKGSAAYVAIERVRGTLQGRAGSFVFQHAGTMHEGTQALSIGVVPGSGTGELAGLAGHFHLSLVDGEHRYRFEYTVP